MKSFFNPKDNKEYIDRINNLNPQSKAQWGKMNAAQMLAHTQVPFNVATGETKLKRGLLGILFGKMAKKKLLNNNPFGKNMPTHKTFKIVEEKNFEEEKQKLIEIVKRFGEKGPEALMKEPHPFFGNLSTEEWDLLMEKHLDHHLRQFGV